MKTIIKIIKFKIVSTYLILSFLLTVSFSPFANNEFKKDTTIYIRNSNIYIKDLDSINRFDVVFYNADSSGNRSKAKIFFQKHTLKIGLGICLIGAAFIEKNIKIARGMLFTGLATSGVGIGLSARRTRVDDTDDVKRFLKKDVEYIHKYFQNQPFEVVQNEDFMIKKYLKTFFIKFTHEEITKSKIRYIKHYSIPTDKLYEIYFDKDGEVFFARFKYISKLDEGWRESKRIKLK